MVSIWFFSISALINLVIGLWSVGVFVWIDAMQFGLLHWVELPLWLEVLIAVMALGFIWIIRYSFYVTSCQMAVEDAHGSS